MNRKKRCAPTRNSPCHRLLGSLTQGQGVCAAGWLSHSHSLVQRGPITDHIVHRFASEVIPESHPGLRRWHVTAIIGIAVHRAARSPCDVACAVKKFSRLIIVEAVGATQGEHLDCALFLEGLLGPLSGTTNPHMDDICRLVDSFLVQML